MLVENTTDIPARRIYWTAFTGLFFDYYDLYLFVYLQKTLDAHFALSATESNWLQFAGLAGVGAGALLVGFLADRFGRARLLLATFVLYCVGIAGLAAAWSVTSLLGARLLASLALGGEWGISHSLLAACATREQRYRYSALLQFSILGGLLAAIATRYALPVVGWRWLFGASIVPVAILSGLRWNLLLQDEPLNHREMAPLVGAIRKQGRRFLLCLMLASLTIASGTMNVFYAKDLPQSLWYTVAFWGLVAPGMLGGAWLVRRWGVARALQIYAGSLVTLSLACWTINWSGRSLLFALLLPVLNGIPFGLMGAYFNEMLGEYRTMLSGSAYNLGRIMAGFSPVLLASLGLDAGGRYFAFTAMVGLGAFALTIPRTPAEPFRS